MRQEIVGQKITAELIDSGICDKKNEEAIWAYIVQAYAAGYNEGRSQFGKWRSVGQYSREDKLIQIFDNCQIAARHCGVTKSAICKAARGTTGTIAGFKWKYINEKKPDRSPDTVGNQGAL